MADILYDFQVKAVPAQVFRAVSSPVGLDAWWTLQAAGAPVMDGRYRLGFGPSFEWEARVTRCLEGVDFEIELTIADADWTGTRVGFRLDPSVDGTSVHFRHERWPQANEHFRISGYCWAMYLRLLRRYLERGEIVPYDLRGDA